jgi:hypothetical protein
MSETYTKLGVPLVSKDKDPVLNAQAQYHTYVRCELAAVISFAAAVSAGDADTRVCVCMYTYMLIHVCVCVYVYV